MRRYRKSQKADGCVVDPARTMTRGLNLHAGEWVEVRPLDEVLATLDVRGCLDAMPFMAEMARFCGQRFQVFKSAHKTCDTIDAFKGRRLDNAVHLDGLRCDGSFHGGCQAGCLLFWKEAWLRRIDGPQAGLAEAPARNRSASRVGAMRGAIETLARQAFADNPPKGELRYRCQATELLRATTPLRLYDPRHFVRDLIVGNLALGTFLRAVAFGLYQLLPRFFGARRHLLRSRTSESELPCESLNLQPGELVQVRSKAEILVTLDGSGQNRGLTFDAEMEPYCGRTFRVLRRVDRIVEEKTGRMLRLRKDCIILDEAVCSGLRCGFPRLGCPRSVYPYWREIWLRRVESAPSHATESGVKSPSVAAA
jgi:hypothetical protein